MRDLLKEAKKSQEVSEDDLIQYTDTMLQVFDSNKDGKLQLSEMAKYYVQVRLKKCPAVTSFFVADCYLWEKISSTDKFSRSVKPSSGHSHKYGVADAVELLRSRNIAQKLRQECVKVGKNNKVKLLSYKKLGQI